MFEWLFGNNARMILDQTDRIDNLCLEIRCLNESLDLVIKERDALRRTITKCQDIHNDFRVDLDDLRDTCENFGQALKGETDEHTS